MVHPIRRTTHDAIEIFEAAYTTRKKEKEQERKREEEMRERLVLEWFRYDNGTGVADRYSPYLGRNTDKEYFMSHTYRCPTNPNCLLRFEDEASARKHGFR